MPVQGERKELKIFVSGQVMESLETYGRCAIVLSRENFEANERPVFAEVVTLIATDTKRGRHTRVKLTARQPLEDGGCVNMFEPVPHIYRA